MKHRHFIRKPEQLKLGKPMENVASSILKLEKMDNVSDSILDKGNYNNAPDPVLYCRKLFMNTTEY